VGLYNLVTDATRGNGFLLGTVAACSATQPLLTLSASATTASIGTRDGLSITDGTNTITSVARDAWGTNNTIIPVSTCTGVNAGMTVTNANGGASVGTVSTCANGALLTLAAPAVNTVSTNDNIAVTSRRQGDIWLNGNPTPGSTIGWTNTTNLATTGINQFGPVSNDTAGNSWTLNAVISAGTKPINSGTCAINTQLGGLAAGSFKANGACAAGTLIFTLATTATNGWVCDAHDLTTPSDSINEIAYTTTTATFVATMAASDLVAFHCTGF
jgi:hypothetical protein